MHHMALQSSFYLQAIVGNKTKVVCETICVLWTIQTHCDLISNRKLVGYVVRTLSQSSESSQAVTNSCELPGLIEKFVS